MHAPRCLVGKPRGPPTRVLQRPTLTGLHAGRGACAGTCAGRGRRRPRRTPPAWNPFPTPQPTTLPQPCRPSACPAAHRRPPRGRLAGPRRRIWRRGWSTSRRSSRSCPCPRDVEEGGVGSVARVPPPRMRPIIRKVSPWHMYVCKHIVQTIVTSSVWSANFQVAPFAQAVPVLLALGSVRNFRAGAFLQGTKLQPYGMART